MELDDARDGAPVPWSARTIDEWARDTRVRVAACVLVIVAGAAWWWHQQHQLSPPGGTSPRTTFSSTTFTAFAGASTSAAQVVVHVTGAVTRSGVVTLPAGARVIDAIDAAGGARRDADVDQLDLAARLVDGSRVYVPKRGETVTTVATPIGGAGGSDGSSAPAGPVDLNTATKAQLEELPGIGPTLAEAILATRDRIGGFKKVDDLRQVHGIGDRRLADLRPLVTV